MDELRQLILDSSRNDRIAQEKLYRRFYPVLFILCKRFFADNHEALEALNNGMLKVFKSMGKFDPAKGAFFNWMYTIVRRAALETFPQLRSALADLSGKLTAADMRQLNAQVDADQRDVAAVVRAFRAAKNL